MHLLCARGCSEFLRAAANFPRKPVREVQGPLGRMLPRVCPGGSRQAPSPCHPPCPAPAGGAGKDAQMCLRPRSQRPMCQGMGCLRKRGATWPCWGLDQGLGPAGAPAPAVAQSTLPNLLAFLKPGLADSLGAEMVLEWAPKPA